MERDKAYGVTAPIMGCAHTEHDGDETVSGCNRVEPGRRAGRDTAPADVHDPGGDRSQDGQRAQTWPRGEAVDPFTGKNDQRSAKEPDKGCFWCFL